MRTVMVLIALSFVGCGLSDYIGIPDISMPDTLTFDTNPTVYEFKSIVDGDEVILTKYGTDYHIKLADVNAPARGQALHAEASNALKEWLMSGPIRVEFQGDRKDIEGRRLAYLVVNVPPSKQAAIHRYESKLPRIYFGGEEGERSEFVCVNMLVVRDGYSRYRPSTGVAKYDSWFKLCEKEASEAKRGIWQDR